MAGARTVDIILEEKPNVGNPSQATKEKPNVGNPSQATKEKPAIKADFSATAFKAIAFFGSTGALIFFGVLAILPIIQVVIGQRYLKECPVSPYIPKYQIVSGAVGLANIIIIIILGVVSVALIKPAMRAAESNSEDAAVRLGVGYCCLVTVMTLILSLVSLFMTVWTILGLVWLFSSWPEVQYINPNQTTYCHPTLYRFNYWIFILPFILGPVIYCIPFCVAGCALRKMEHKGVLVPTTEP